MSAGARAAVPLLQDVLTVSAARLPRKTALVCRDRRVAYADIERASDALAKALARRGVQRGDRVIVFAENSVEAAVSFWAVLKADAVVSMINPQTKAEKLAYLLNDCRASALIADAHLAPVVVEAARRTPHLRATLIAGGGAGIPSSLPGGVGLEVALAETDGGPPPVSRNIDLDLAAIIYTSGSTGEPKGVMLSHRNMTTAARSISSYLGNTERDVLLNVLPFSFDYGLYQMILAFLAGATLVLERSFAYPGEILERVVAESVTAFPGVPTMFSVFGEMRGLQQRTFPTVRYVTNTAAALAPWHVPLLRRIFPQARIFSMYGLTECKRCTYLPPEDLERKPGSVGIAIPNTELWIVDEAGQRVGPGVVGQLVIRGGTVMQGYWEKPVETAERLRPGPLPGERVLFTGDYCRLDEDGYLYFVSRMDEIIKSRGEKVAPREVELALLAIEGVKEAAVIGVPDDVLGQSIKAFVVPFEGIDLTPREIQRECHERLESFMVPQHVEIVAGLPRTESGKVKKTGLR